MSSNMDELCDIKLDEFGDFVVAANGDIAVCFGADVIAQDISSRTWTLKGTCPDTYPTPTHDPGIEYGYGIQEKAQCEIYSSTLERWRSEYLVQLSRDGRYTVDDAQVVLYSEGLFYLVQAEYDGSALEVSGGAS